MVEAAVRAVRERFGPRLAAVYLTGSVLHGEALPGVSDLDVFTFLIDEPTSDDRDWAASCERDFPDRFAYVPEAHLNLNSAARLRDEAFWRYALRWCSVRLAGADLVSALEREGIATDAPGPDMARQRMLFARPDILDRATGRVSEQCYPTPADPRLAARKMAQYFVVLPAAYLAMAEGRFRSFAAREVLPGLAEAYPQWSALAELAERAIRLPLSAGLSPQQLVGHVSPFLDFVEERLRGPSSQ